MREYKAENVLWNSNRLLGRYSGHFWQNFSFWELGARVELILITGLWLARLGSKHKSLSEITNIQVQENNHAHLL